MVLDGGGLVGVEKSLPCRMSDCLFLLCLSYHAIFLCHDIGISFHAVSDDVSRLENLAKLVFPLDWLLSDLVSFYIES